MQRVSRYKVAQTVKNNRESTRFDNECSIVNISPEHSQFSFSNESFSHVNSMVTKRMGAEIKLEIAVCYSHWRCGTNLSSITTGRIPVPGNSGSF